MLLSNHKNCLFLSILVTVTTVVFLFFSSWRLALFGAGLDLGFFDQLLYLQSQELPPISTLIEGVHLIGDHAAFILYPLSLFYIIKPDVHWLLFIQAFSLASGAIPIYLIAQNNNLTNNICQALAISYVLYPALFNINFYTEFRTETIAVPVFLWAIWAVEKNNFFWVTVFILGGLLCKDTMSFTVIGFGLWLLVKRKINYGLFYIFLGVIWFAIVVIYILPNFRVGEVTAGISAGMTYYSSLGNSFSELVINIFTNPLIIIKRALISDRLFYYLLLVLPIILGLSLKKITFFIPALPMLLLNILSDDGRVRDLIHQYSLPIIPFLFAWLTYSIIDIYKYKTRKWLSSRVLITWAIIAFFALAKYGYFPVRYFPLIPYNQDVKIAIKMIDHQASVMTSSYIANHLSHRKIITTIPRDNSWEKINSSSLEYILISRKHLDYPITVEQINNLIDLLEESMDYNLVYQNKEVFLFKSNKS
jgi:uncharacterized membrane protein